MTPQHERIFAKLQKLFALKRWRKDSFFRNMGALIAAGEDVLGITDDELEARIDNALKANNKT